MRFKPWADKDWLEEKYCRKRMTIDQIAEECNKDGYPVTSMTIFNALKKFSLMKHSRNLGPRSVGGNSSKKRGYYG